ncbi:uncharacterized protein LOC127392985 isoform X2 [Apus apus]|uniref:uncharacterized protein LOC127392985 isoform X2 n=1 Tax=Apus apus TaxID=8895 RepID=UPI0021F8E386|nr:uncharacterized protein LOC127392985 isoform X2 [Apus apus]
MGQQRHLDGFHGPVLPAPCLLLRQTGCTTVPPGTHPAPFSTRGRNSHLQVRELVPERRVQVRARSPALPGAQPGAAPVPEPVPGTSREVLKNKRH